jgi:hypothetical protein
LASRGLGVARWRAEHQPVPNSHSRWTRKRSGHTAPTPPGKRLSRFASGNLFAEGGLVAAVRLLTFVYVLASEAYASDESHLPLTSFLPGLLGSITLVGVLLWAGSLRGGSPTAPGHLRGDDRGGPGPLPTEHARVRRGPAASTTCSSGFRATANRHRRSLTGRPRGPRSSAFTLQRKTS